MSTRSTMHFAHGERVEAIIYRHSDGYPEGAGADLLAFFDRVRTDTKDTRFEDPSYLAAKYVVFLAQMFNHKYQPDPKTGEWDFVEGPAWSLDFLSVGVMMEDPGDIEYRYIIDSSRMIDGRPWVEVQEVGGDSLGDVAAVLKAVPA